jgi:hypothetical protein
VASAFDCCKLLFEGQTIIIFFGKREEKKENKRRKKDMQVKQQCSGGCQGFLEKYYPKRSGGWRFFQKPAGLDLYCR